MLPASQRCTLVSMVADLFMVSPVVILIFPAEAASSTLSPFARTTSFLWLMPEVLIGKGFAKMLHQRIIASGTSLPWSDGTTTDYGFAAPVAQVGNGLINAFKVVNYTTSLSFESIFALNDTAHFRGAHDLTITNNGATAVTYRVSHESAAGVEILGWFPFVAPWGGEKRLRRFTELTPTSLPVELAAVPPEVTLGAGESTTLT